MTIYIGNLSFQATEEDLREVFAEYGKVSRISLPTDRETGRKRGFAFVEMEDEAQEEQAISELDGAEWLGRELRVNRAKPIPTLTDNSGVVVSGGVIELGSKPGYQREYVSLENSPKLETGLSQQELSTKNELRIVLQGSLKDISKPDLDILVDLLRELSGDQTIKILDVQSGSIVLKLSGTEEGFRILKELWETGKITSLIGLSIECIEFEVTSSQASEGFETSSTNLREVETGIKPLSEGTITYIFNQSTVHQNNQTALSRATIQADSQGTHMSENYTNNLQGANIANMANAVKDNARQQANQHIHGSEQKQTLAESAGEIQQLLKQLEKTNPTATEIEKIDYINDETTPGFKRRVVGALQAGGEAAIEEFLDNPYVNVGKAVVKGWMKPE